MIIERGSARVDSSHMAQAGHFRDQQHVSMLLLALMSSQLQVRFIFVGLTANFCLAFVYWLLFCFCMFTIFVFFVLERNMFPYPNIN